MQANDWLTLAQEQLQLGLHEIALGSFNVALELDPELIDAWDGKADCFQQLRRYGEANQARERAIALRSQSVRFDADFWFDQGKWQLDTGDFEGALVSFDRFLELRVDAPPAWSNRGNSLNKLGRYEEALASYDQALELQPDDSWIWSNRGSMLNNWQQYEAALKSAEQAIAIQSTNSHAWYVQGFALNGLGNYEEALASYDRALELQPNDPDALYSRGNSLYFLRRCEEAITSYDRVLELQPNDPDVWDSRGLALGYLGRYEESIASHDRSLKLRPDNPTTWYNRGISLYFVRRYEESIASYDRALGLQPDDLDFWYMRSISTFKSPGYHKTLISNSLPLYMQNTALDLRGYIGQIACLQEGFKYIPEGTENWGKLQEYLGDAHREWGDRQQVPYPYWHKSIPCYQKAFDTFIQLNTIQPALEALAKLIRVNRALHVTDEVVSALQRRGAALLKRLLVETPSDLQKQRFGLRFSSFGQTTVDLLIQQEQNILALETAEADKNWLMTWLLRWQDPDTIPTASYSAMRQLLRPGTAIVYWHYSPDALTTFILRWDNPQPIVISTAKYNSQQGMKQVQQLETWLTNWSLTYAQFIGKDKDNPDRDTTWRYDLPKMISNLADLLDVVQINASLVGVTHLMLVPHRDLHRLPLTALFSSETLQSVTVLPSLQLGLSLRPSVPLALKATASLSIEAPQHDDQASLPHAFAESLLLRQFLPKAIAISDREATLATVQQALEQSPAVIHFNGHAAYNVAQPKKSALALTGEDKLTVEAIYGLPPLHDCQLVSLASCETAIAGTQTITSEYVGLVSAFLSHQIPHVLSTLWTVESEASALFILHFYEQIQQGNSVPQAFQQTQIWLRTVTAAELKHKYQQWLNGSLPDGQDGRRLKDFLETEKRRLSRMGPDDQPYDHPYFWAAFTLSGLPQ